MRLLLSELLSSGGRRTLTANDGAHAQLVLQREPVDVVVTDLLMPQMTGLELMRWAQDETPGPVWIIYSGLETFKAAAEAIELGAFAFLPKPMGGSLKPLRKTVARAFSHVAIVKDRARLSRELSTMNVRLKGKVDQLSNLCGLLNQQATIIEQDLHRARLIQRALLPPEPPPMERFVMNARYRPCSHVGGDLYNVVALPKGLVGFYVADASGHGVSAAMLSVLFKHRLKLIDAEGNPQSPAVVLESVNRSLLAECRGRGVFVTVIYGLLNPATGDLTLAAAGHPPALLHHFGGDVELIEHTGPAIGLDEQASFGEEHVRMAPRDRLLLFTDGLLGGTESTEPLSAAELARVMADEVPGGAALLNRLAGLSESDEKAFEEHDDVTLLLIECAEGEAIFDNGASADGRISAPLPVVSTAEILRGVVSDAVVVCLRGRATWTHAPALLETCAEAIEEGFPLTLDLSACRYLDSTVLGTIHEAVTRAVDAEVPVHVLEVRPEVRDLFEELSMSCVLDRIGSSRVARPKRLSSVQSKGLDVEASRERVIEAHLALAELSAENREEFLQVVAELRGEADSPPAS